MKTVKIILVAGCIFILIVPILFSYNVIWKSPGFYKVQQSTELKEPIMDMNAYEQIRQTHRRPYIYSVNSSSGGAVHVLGIDHLKDKNHPQIDSISYFWNKTNPTVAFVEGRLGFLFTWIQDPVEKYGEGGLVSKLAKRDGIKLYTWEPTRNDEIEILIEEFSAEKLAMFYSFRPYFSNMRHGKPEDPERKLQEYIDSRTDYDHIRGIFRSWEELDSVWQNDFPNINWRDYTDEYGWPEGYLERIANSSNLARDFHMIQTIIELVNKGERVFVTMGSSHAPRIEKALRTTIQ